MISTIKYTKKFLSQLENLIAESDYILRYEKGQFNFGYCLLNEQKIIIVNKFYTTEGKINALLAILKLAPFNTQRMNEDSKKIYDSMTKKPLQITQDK